ncbi:MAG: ParB/RepB/Spo0J family partition protein [Promethearchaeota archaeon]|jgi:hypothetical protein
MKSIVIKFIPNVSDFSKYRRLPQKNRTVAQSQVKALVESFKRFGACASTIIVIKTNAFGKKARYYIADGQHRIEAAEITKESMDVKIIELTDDTTLNVTQFIATLNNNAKAWSTINFLKAFASNGLAEYQMMLDIKEKTKLTITDLLYIFMGNGGAKENKLFKGGEMKFADKNKSIKVLASVLSVKDILPNKSFIRRNLIKAFNVVEDCKAMAEAIKKAVEKGVDFSENEQEFKKQIENLQKKQFLKVA